MNYINRRLSLESDDFPPVSDPVILRRRSGEGEIHLLFCSRQRHSPGGMLVVLKIDVIALIKSQYKVDKTEPYSYFV